MSTAVETTNGQLHLQNSHLDDEEWVKTIDLRKSSGDLATAARQGDSEKFTSLLRDELQSSIHLTKTQRRALIGQLEVLFGSIDGEWADALFNAPKKKSEFSNHVQSLLDDASIAETATDSDSLVLAQYTLLLLHDRLQSSTLFHLWRWVASEGQSWLESRPVCDPEQGLSQLRFLEVCFLLSITLRDLKGSTQLRKETISLLRSCLDEATDNDGTPQPQWLPTLIDSLAIFARLTSLAAISKQKLWNRNSHQRLLALVGRCLALCSSNQMAFIGHERTTEFKEDLRQLQTVNEVLSGEKKSDASRYLKSLIQETTPKKRKSEWQLPETSFQSDWAMLANLRSPWWTSIDQCVVAHDSSALKIDVVVQNTPLFAGSLQQLIDVDGRRMKTDESWSCTCWYEDDEVNFLELLQEIDSKTKVLSQFILLREDQQMMWNQVVHAEAADRIDLKSSVPFSNQCDLEKDSATREAALQSFDQRIRILPLSLPQQRVEGGSGQITVNGDQLVIEESAEAERLFVSTLFDWSPRRMHRPVDWSRLTVAQDGKLEPADQAVGYRYRIGRDQWLFFHSLTEPEIPRTVLGMHTQYETVLGRFNSKGNVEEIVEVEV